MPKRDRWDSDDSDDYNIEEKGTKGEPEAVNAPPPTHNPLTDGCRLVYDTYEQIERISEGTYGIVWKAVDMETDEIVALKQVKFDSANTSNLGFPVMALREINVLLALSHESIVSVREMVVGDHEDRVFMVMEYFEFDLKKGLERFDGPLPQGELKGIMQQVLSAVSYIHSKWYLHRDLKCSNILVHRTGRVAVADFGLARRFQEPAREMTQMVVTLWYRSPELLCGETRYGPPVDMWSLGCVFAELICKEPIMRGQGELDQIDQIFSTVGHPNDEDWPSFKELPNTKIFRWKSNGQKPLLPSMFGALTPASSNQAFLDDNGYNLLTRLLTLDPSKRISASDALQHPYFSEGVAPARPKFFVN